MKNKKLVLIKRQVTTISRSHMSIVVGGNQRIDDENISSLFACCVSEAMGGAIVPESSNYHCCNCSGF